jgi:hypothetical protein
MKGKEEMTMATIKGSTNRWITLEDVDGTRRRYNLASMRRLGIRIPEGAYDTGVILQEVYLQPRSRRVILETYSIWEDRRTHCCEGTRYHLADADTIGQLAARTGNEQLLALVPEGVES